MNTIIYKYHIKLSAENNLRMPKGSIILGCQVQHEDVVIWAKTPTKGLAEDRHIRVFGTGQIIDDSEGELIYIDTVQLRGGKFIFHVFELKI